MNDVISRQAAIDTLHMDTSIIPYKKAREYADATILEIRNRLEKLPSAEPKTGRWSGVRYDAELGLFVCDNCGMFSFMEYAFCPNCGADMRGEKNETYRC